MRISDVPQLLAAEAPEGATLDWKRDLPGRSDDDKREFLKDVVSFANTLGGLIVYGVDERREDGATTGLPGEVVGVGSGPLDDEVRRLSSLILSATEPAISGVKIEAVDVPGARLLVVEVPKSWLGPHRMVHGKVKRFTARTNSQTYEMTVDHLREAFIGAASARERIRSHRADRLDAIRREIAERHVAREPLLVLHLIALASIAGDVSLDISERSLDIRMPDTRGGMRTYSLDGVRVSSGDLRFAYVQASPEGVLEAAVPVGRGETEVNLVACETFATSWSEHHCRFLASHGVAGPAYLFVSLLNVRGRRRSIPGYIPLSHDVLPADRDVMAIPEVSLPDLSLPPASDQLQAAFDTLWRGFGAPRSLSHEFSG